MSGAFEIAYATIKRNIVQGTFPPGEHIDIRRIENELSVSTSPIREALTALASEGMIYSAKGVGFQVPAFDLASVADLVKWRGYLSDLAIRTGVSIPNASYPMNELGHLERTADLFRAIGSISENRDVARALANATDRLHNVHRLEIRVLPGVREELEALEAAVYSQNPHLRRHLQAYTRRQLSALPKLAMAIRAAR